MPHGGLTTWPSNTNGRMALCLPCAPLRPSTSLLPNCSTHAAQQEWVIPPEEIHYLKRPNGELFVLGEGAR